MIAHPFVARPSRPCTRAGRPCHDLRRSVYIPRKRRDCRESEVIQVWIDPEKRFIEQIHPGRALEYVQEGEVFTIAGVPEFKPPVTQLFVV